MFSGPVERRQQSKISTAPPSSNPGRFTGLARLERHALAGHLAQLSTNVEWVPSADEVGELKDRGGSLCKALHSWPEPTNADPISSPQSCRRARTQPHGPGPQQVPHGALLNYEPHRPEWTALYRLIQQQNSMGK